MRDFHSIRDVQDSIWLLPSAPLRALIHFARIEVTVLRPRIELVGDLNLHLFLLLAPTSLPSR